MRKLFSLFWLLTLVPYCSLYAKSVNELDSVYLFAYSTSKNVMRNGLHFAWSVNRKNWDAIGPELSFLKCDYGGGAEGKKMITPFLFQGSDQLWHCLWNLNENDGVFAHTTSQDLIYWKSQSYPVVMKNGNCLQPEVVFNSNTGKYEITWLSSGTNGVKAYRVSTSDFKVYSDAMEIQSLARPNLGEKIQLNGNEETGVVRKVSWKMLDGLLQKQQLEVSKRKLNSENMKDDAERFSGLQPINASITVNQANTKKISDKLIGAFFEDLNYSADGGLYAELIQNRGFEYTLSDKDGKDKT
nr:alpha-L-arabinofuranosidase [Parabacteroides sp.]